MAYFLWKLGQSEFFLELMALHQHDEEKYRYSMTACLWSLDGAWEQLKAEYRECAGFEEWEQAAMAEMKADPVLRHLHDRRNAYTHSQPPYFDREEIERPLANPESAALGTRVRQHEDGTFVEISVTRRFSDTALRKALPHHIALLEGTSTQSVIDEVRPIDSR
ncbi:MAG: hypothetical protein C4521_11650 [Actinobacteria bacterium]|nr:MAG: hypothetical protein C4521_11650 [Actinomycetota bacterium]